MAGNTNDIRAGGCYIEIGGNDKSLEEALGAAKAKMQSWAADIGRIGNSFAGVSATVNNPILKEAGDHTGFGARIGLNNIQTKTDPSADLSDKGRVGFFDNAAGRIQELEFASSASTIPGAAGVPQLSAISGPRGPAIGLGAGGAIQQYSELCQRTEALMSQMVSLMRPRDMFAGSLDNNHLLPGVADFYQRQIAGQAGLLPDGGAFTGV
jgi:hypothetical protein